MKMTTDDRFLDAEQLIAGSPELDTMDTVARLAAMPPIEYDRVREVEADRLKVRLSTLDKQVAMARGRGHQSQSGDAGDGFLIDPEPWPDPVDGADLLDRMTDLIASHLVLPKWAAEAIALWIMHAHTHDCFGISPVLGVTSPTPECGKTTCLTLIGGLVPRALPASNITTAALFRAVESWRPTLLIDEADTFLNNSDEMRGVLNSGHQRANAYVIRTVGDDHAPKRFRTWSPKVIALIGKLAATLASRAIHIELRRKTVGETVRPLRADRLDHLRPLCRQAARWAEDNASRVSSIDPHMPATLSGRAADNWRPLIAIADMAGGNWPARARRVAEELGGRAASNRRASCCSRTSSRSCDRECRPHSISGAGRQTRQNGGTTMGRMAECKTHHATADRQAAGAVQGEARYHSHGHWNSQRLHAGTLRRCI